MFISLSQHHSSITPAKETQSKTGISVSTSAGVFKVGGCGMDQNN